MNLLLGNVMDFVSRAQDQLEERLGMKDEHYSIYGDEPDSPKNYKTETGYKAVVQDRSSDEVRIIFKNGRIAEMISVPF